jgi:hypothetical protein
VRFAFVIDSIELKDKFPATDVAEPINGARLFGQGREWKRVGSCLSTTATRRASRVRRRFDLSTHKSTKETTTNAKQI